MRAQMVEYWFRKLDVVHDNVIDKSELAAFFAAMKQVSFREEFLADFLLNLFDRDLDQRLDRDEMQRLIRVMVGHEPTPDVLDHLCGKTGSVSREELVKILHEVHGDLKNLEKSTAATLGKNTATDVLTLLVIVGAVVGGVAWYVSRRNASA